MKKIALQLGLKDDATEAEIITAISTLQLSHSNTEAMRSHIEGQAAEQLQGEPEKKLFVELSKTNISAALAFLSLHKKGLQISEDQVSVGASKVQKDVRISELIQKGKWSLGRNTGDENDEKTNCFDYFQRKKPAELKRIKAEEPERYAQLVADYAAGIRYSA